MTRASIAAAPLNHIAGRHASATLEYEFRIAASVRRLVPERATAKLRSDEKATVGEAMPARMPVVGVVAAGELFALTTIGALLNGIDQSSGGSAYVAALTRSGEIARFHPTG